MKAEEQRERERFDNGGRGHEPRNTRKRFLEAGKGKKVDSLLQHPEEQFGFRSVEPISDNVVLF